MTKKSGKKIAVTIQLISFLLLSLMSYSKNYSRQNYIIISGKIENISKQVNDKRTIRITPPFYLKDKKSKIIELAQDGTFKDSISNNPGLYYIDDGKNQVPIYLQNSKQYIINYNASDFRRGGSVSLEGDDIDVNKYFIEKMQKRIYVDRNNINRSEKDFRKHIDSIRSIQLNRLKNSKLPKDLKAEENKNIQYEYLSELFYFLVQAKGLPISSLSKESQDELNINYSNENDYKKYGYYSKLVLFYYEQKVIDLYGKPIPQNLMSLMTPNILRQLDSLVPNKYIKNDIIKLDARSYLEIANDKEAFYNDFLKYYTGSDEKFKLSMNETYLRLTKLKPGTPSPDFFNYSNFDGGTNSLKDFRGKYVFIDIWATWCGNCWVEMPYLKELEEKNKDKNIVFVSLSCDKFENEWRETIKKKELQGIQLLAKNTDDVFFKNYAVQGIPRYILIDPNGLIVDYNAPRPSEKGKMEKLLQNVK